MTRLAHLCGKYNKSKGKIILLLAQEPNSWYSARQMHYILGVPVGSVRNIVRRLHWCRPPYIKRRLVGNYLGTWRYEYAIGVRGAKWFSNALHAGMPVNEFVQEVNDWQRSRR
ncbi:MAG TPA: hypothetical protein VGA85_07935 [Dehalococcoidales bacterium]